MDSVPSTVSVQTREQLDRQNVNNIKELVRWRVSVYGAGQRAGITGYNIRGIDGNRISTQIRRGRQLPNDFFSGPYAQTPPQLRRSDIVARAKSFAARPRRCTAATPSGGAESYFTPRPVGHHQGRKDVGARLKAGYESASHSWLTSATVAGRADDFDGLLHYGYRQGHETESNGGHGGTGSSRSEANPEDADSYSLLGKLGWNTPRAAASGWSSRSTRATSIPTRRAPMAARTTKGKAGHPPSMLPGGMYQWRKGNDTLTRERYGLEHHFLLRQPGRRSHPVEPEHQLAKTDQATREF